MFICLSPGTDRLCEGTLPAYLLCGTRMEGHPRNHWQVSMKYPFDTTIIVQPDQKGGWRQDGEQTFAGTD